MVDWDDGMGELYYTNDGCLFLCQMQVRVGENPQALLGNGLHSVFLYPSVHLGKQD